MVWWWIGNAVLLLVIVPTVIFFANKVLRPVFEIKAYADDVLVHGVGLTGEMDGVAKLRKTRDLAATTRAAVGRYGAALERLR